MKAAGSYESLIRGVSQQVAQDRAPGQHAEQVNLLSDPVNGLTRRHGSQLVAEKVLPGLAALQFASYIADTDNFRSFEYASAGSDYVVLIRTKARPATANPLPVMIVYNRTTKVFLNLVRNVTDAQLDLVESGGISAITAVGKYLFFAGNSTVVSNTSTDIWASATNLDRAVVWVRGGAFSRTYSVTATRTNGTRVTFTYTTPSSSYQTPLDTSDIAYNTTDYTKLVNDRVNAYNAAVTQWIGTSTAAVQPAAIAEQLRVAGAAAGLTVSRNGSHVIFAGVTALVTDDGGDGTLIRGVADEVASVDQVSVIHHVGKVVKVRSRNANEAYYLKAIAKDTSVTTGYTEVTWIEGAGVEHSINSGIFFGTVVGANMYLASTPALLTAITAGPHPTYSISTAGDNDSSPRPFFLGRRITYLGAFQNRLIVGSGGVLAVSNTEDYLNFFRSTVLTAPASDPFEMQAQGSEDDELRFGTLYDRDLIIFGTKRQYIISGRVPMAPTSANMAVMTQFQDVSDSPPITAGGYIFYNKRGEKYSSLHQIQPGQNGDSPESFTASSQIDSYLVGGVIELATIASPSMLFLRTTGARQSIYTFGYLDTIEGRKLDSWSRWDFASELGIVIGFAVIPDGLLAFSLRTGASGVYVVCDFCPVLASLSLYPYLDSQRPLSAVTVGTGSVLTSTAGDWAAAFDSTSERRFTGRSLEDLALLQAAYPGETAIRVGALQEAYVEPTNPFMRDGKDKAILSGRLTITKLVAAFRNTTGFDWVLNYREQVETSQTFNGRVLGDPTNLIGIEPVTTGQSSIPIGREARQYRLIIKARKWYPFNLTAIEWVGQFFNRVQRF